MFEDEKNSSLKKEATFKKNKIRKFMNDKKKEMMK
jgi:hypothetical protein